MKHCKSDSEMKPQRLPKKTVSPVSSNKGMRTGQVSNSQSKKHPS